jgi:hypothetical protein
MDSNLKKFNKTVCDFVKELKNLFEETDKDIENIETFYEMTKINARAIMGPFQTYILKKTSFVKYIMEEDVNYFMEYNFDQIISSDSPYSKYAKSLVLKFREVIQKHMKENKQVVKAMFEWFKLMTFYASSDLNMDINDVLNGTSYEASLGI